MDLGIVSFYCGVTIEEGSELHYPGALARAQGHLTGPLGSLLLHAQQPLGGAQEQQNANQGCTGTGLEPDLRATQNLSISGQTPGVLICTWEPARMSCHLKCCRWLCSANLSTWDQGKMP